MRNARAANRLPTICRWYFLGGRENCGEKNRPSGSKDHAVNRKKENRQVNASHITALKWMINKLLRPLDWPLVDLKHRCIGFKVIGKKHPSCCEVREKFGRERSTHYLNKLGRFIIWLTTWVTLTRNNVKCLMQKMDHRWDWIKLVSTTLTEQTDSFFP